MTIDLLIVAEILQIKGGDRTQGRFRFSGGRAGYPFDPDTVCVPATQNEPVGLGRQISNHDIIGQNTRATK